MGAPHLKKFRPKKAYCGPAATGSARRAAQRSRIPLSGQCGSARSRPTKTRIVEGLRVERITRKEWGIEDIGMTPSSRAGTKSVTLKGGKAGVREPKLREIRGWGYSPL